MVNSTLIAQFVNLPLLIGSVVKDILIDLLSLNITFIKLLVVKITLIDRLVAKSTLLVNKGIT